MKSGTLLKKMTISLFIAVSAILAGQETSVAQITRTAGSVAELNSALSAAGAGDTIMLTPNGRVLTVNSALSSAAPGLTLNGQNGQIVGNGAFRLLDLNSAAGLASVQNIEMNRGNAGAGNGGALRVQAISNGISYAAFRQNSANQGGGVYVQQSMSGGIQNNIHFDRNTAAAEGGGLFVGESFSGGINGFDRDTHFDSNTAGTYGGGMYVFRSFSGNISRNYFANNSAGVNGGGLYVGGDFTGNLGDYSFFSGNTAGARGTGYGGAMFVGGIFRGNMSGARVTDNKATSGGGGFWLEGFSGNISGADFERNQATQGSGGALLVNNGGIQGSVSGTFIDNIANGSGGAIYLGGAGDISGGLANVNFRTNTAIQGSGGAIYTFGNIQGGLRNSTFDNNSSFGSVPADGGGGAIFAAGLQGNISNTNFTNNFTQGYGGAMHLGVLTGSILNSTFTNNSAGRNGGAVYLSADGSNIVLSADGGRDTTFMGNRSNAELNSFYFNAADSTMTVGGAGNVFLNDPLYGVNSDVNFQVNDNRGGGNVFLGGANYFSGGDSTFNFNQGNVQLRPDYVLRQDAHGSMDVRLGADGNRVNLAMDLSQRDPNLAIFDFRGATSGTFVLGSDAFIVAPRTLLPQVGRYLLVDGGGVVALPSQAELDAFKNGQIIETHEYKARLERDGNQIWLVMEYEPSVDPGTTTGKPITPNTPIGLASLDCWLQNTLNGLAVFGSNEKFATLKANVGSVAPQEAADLGWISMNTHTKVADRAVALAFSKNSGPGSLYGQGGGRAAETGRNGPHLWGAYLGSFDQHASNTKGYSGYDAKSNGVLAGLTWDAGPNISFGGYFAWLDTDIDFNRFNSSGDTKSTHFGLLGRYALPGGFRGTLDAAYSRHDNDLRRNPGGLSRSNDSFDQDVYSLGLELAYDFAPFRKARLTPYAAGRQVWLKQDGFSESNGDINTTLDSLDAAYFVTRLGADFAYDLEVSDSVVLTPEIGLGWRHNYGDKYISAMSGYVGARPDGTPCAKYELKSRPQDRDALVLKTGLELLLETDADYSWGLSALYTREESANGHDDAFTAGLSLSF